MSRVTLCNLHEADDAIACCARVCGVGSASPRKVWAKGNIAKQIPRHGGQIALHPAGNTETPDSHQNIADANCAAGQPARRARQ